mmetsp:Transcript_7816/g.17530  ORF Transcript_7816/g.17530 Transcript_7816/m.17530 type:complete len:228 (-) Transcript_7816:165-848(-)
MPILARLMAVPVPLRHPPLPLQRKKILCLHGFRTSGKIMYMQTAAMRFHTPLQYTFMDGPCPAEADPDPLVMEFYPNRPYFEWYQRDRDPPGVRGMKEATEEVVRFLKTHGPFQGLMGFSQGASLVTTLAHMQQTQHELFRGGSLFDFVVLIGGVTPPLITAEEAHLLLPSCHIMGTRDHVYVHSQALTTYYDASSRVVLQHNEGHNIPSLRAGLYPLISEFVHALP